jgi:hypothetical protein
MCLGSPASTTRLIAAAHHIFTIDSRTAFGRMGRSRTHAPQGAEDCIGNCRWEHESLSVLSDEQLADDSIFREQRGRSANVRKAEAATGIVVCRIRSGDSWALIGPRAIRQPANELSKGSIFGYDESLMYHLCSWPIVFPGRSRLIVYPWSCLSTAPNQNQPREAEQPQLNSIGSSREESAMSGVP